MTAWDVAMDGLIKGGGISLGRADADGTTRQEVATTIASSLELIDGRTDTDRVSVPVKNLRLLITAAKAFVEKDSTILRRHFRNRRSNSTLQSV